jgi:hypothetical protein
VQAVLLHPGGLILLARVQEVVVEEMVKLA